jgi:hypothetical protein
MKFALQILACLLIPGIIIGALTESKPSPAPQPVKLTIVQQAAADKAAARLEEELEAANIEGAFNRALNRVGSRTQAYEIISAAKSSCFSDTMYKYLDKSDGRTRAQWEISCSHTEASEHPAVEIYVFGAMP